MITLIIGRMYTRWVIRNIRNSY